MSNSNINITLQKHIKGNKHAPLILLEYGDYECASCGLAYRIINQVLKHFKQQLKFVYRHFPLSEIHPHAEAAAETAEFAGTYNKFWEMHAGFYENQHLLSVPFLLQLTVELKLPVTELQLALKNGIYRPTVRNDFLSGVRKGVTETPTIFVNSLRYRGPLEYKSLVAAITQAA